MMDQPNNFYVFPNAVELAGGTANFIVETARKAIDKNGQFVIALSGGQTPEQLYFFLSEPPYADRIEWGKTFVFWSDERCVPLNDDRSNANMAMKALLSRVPIPSMNIRTMPVDMEPEKAAEEYELIIKNFFGDNPPRFDLVLLGLGENGHTASIFPNSDVVFENTALVRSVYVEQQQMFRITMTANLINLAHNILFLVQGEEKAQVLKTILTAPYQPNIFPAQLVKPERGNLYWFVDADAASLFPEDITIQ